MCHFCLKHHSIYICIEEEMGSSESGEVADGCVGSLVWVRRRNGSWWPGKILGQEELSLSHIRSPRSGTPVKLLGREDASVDWYNLEKSKRVKAFRCGEFDDSIERAEATQGMPPKKREKYARREDAILHALELERQLLENKYGKLENSSNHRSKTSPDAATSSEYLGRGFRNKNDSRSDQIPEKLGSSAIENNAAVCLYEVIARDESQLSGDDDSASVLPRTRGLQDFGLRTAPISTAPIREELSGVASRAKRSRRAYLSNDSGDYLNDSRFQSSQAEMSVYKLEEKDCPYSDLGDEHISGSTEDTETDCSETDSMESDSDDDLTALSDGSASIELRPKYPRIEDDEGHESINGDDRDELTFPDDLSNPNELEPTKSGVSKWQLKRKRNNRSLGKRSLDRTDSEVFRRYMNRRSSNWTSGGIKPDASQKTRRTHAARYRSVGQNVIDSDVLKWNNPSAKRGFWEDPREYTDIMLADRHHFGGRMMLVEVDLEVQASNYRRDVPFISLLSMLNGHAIIGHPIQIEVLESGSSENVLATDDNTLPESLDSPNRLPPSWRTGRRTANSRIPRPRLYPSIESDCKQQDGFVSRDSKLPCGSSQGQKANMSIPSFSNYSADRIVSGNSPRKMSPFTSQKIRTLSSIATEQKNRPNDMRSGGSSSSNDYHVDGLIKTECVPTTVACIPVNLVFSRLHEELLGRHQ